MSYVSFKNAVLNKIASQEYLLSAEMQEFKISEELTVKAVKLEEGEPVFDLNDKPLEIGDFTFESKVYKLEEGVIKTIEDEVKPEADAKSDNVEQLSEDGEAESVSSTELEDANKRVAELEVENNELKAQVAELKEQLSELTGEVDALKDETIQLSKQPAVDDRDFKVEIKPEDMTPWQRTAKRVYKRK
jgi:chromosome segregation ATPase